MPGVGGGVLLLSPRTLLPLVFPITWGSPINRHPLRGPPHGPGVAGARAAVPGAPSVRCPVSPVHGARCPVAGRGAVVGGKGAVGGLKERWGD